jgi:hypothetical protein
MSNWFLPHAVLCFLLVGCGGSPPSDPATPPAGSAQPAADAEADDGSVAAPEDAKRRVAVPEPQGAPPAWLTQPPVAYTAGDALKYLPKDCDERVYIDVGKLVGSEAGEVKSIIETAINSEKDAREKGRLQLVLRLLREEGADPVSDWREVALCVGKGGEMAAIGIARDKPIEVPLLIQKLKVALDDNPGAVVREGDVSMLIADGETFAQPAPHILLVGDTKEQLLDALGKRLGAAGFERARGHLVLASTQKGELAVKQVGDNLDLRLGVVLQGGMAERAKKQRGAVVSELQEQLKRVADGMKGTPLAPVGERLRAVKVSIAGGKASFAGSINRRMLMTALKDAAADLDAIARAMR